MRGAVHHIDLTVKDAKASRTFYETVLGFMGYVFVDDHERGFDMDLVRDGQFVCSIGILNTQGANAGTRPRPLLGRSASHRLGSRQPRRRGCAPCALAANRRDGARSARRVSEIRADILRRILLRPGWAEARVRVQALRSGRSMRSSGSGSRRHRPRRPNPRTMTAMRWTPGSSHCVLLRTLP